MKKLLFQILGIGIIATTIVSCSDYPGYEKNENGLYYKFYVKKDGAKPKETDVAIIDLVYKLKTNDKDSVLFDNRKFNSPVQILVSKPLYKGDITEGISMMGIGDSASFIISADSFFTKNINQALPPFIKPGSKLNFEIKLNKILTKAEYEQQIAEARAKQDSLVQKMKNEEPLTMDKFIKDSNLKGRKTSTGLFISETKKGTGAKPLKGNKVKVHYTGKFLNGQVFDSSVERNEAFEFTLGNSEVIKGWDEGIALLNKGAKAILVIPSNLAYGEMGSGPIPPYAPLVFEVELIDFQ